MYPEAFAWSCGFFVCRFIDTIMKSYKPKTSINALDWSTTEGHYKPVVVDIFLKMKKYYDEENEINLFEKLD